MFKFVHFYQEYKLRKSPNQKLQNFPTNLRFLVLYQSSKLGFLV